VVLAGVDDRARHSGGVQSPYHGSCLGEVRPRPDDVEYHLTRQDDQLPSSGPLVSGCGARTVGACACLVCRGFSLPGAPVR